MKRQSQFGDANMMSPYAANQLQQVPVQRMQQTPGLSSYPGHMGSFMREDDRSYASSANTDDQWQWDRDTQQMSPHLFREEQGQGNNENQSFYQNQISSSKPGQDTVGREKNSSLQTFEGLEKQFSDDIMKMMKEQMDAEDAENARHREKILEINNQYQEKLVGLRARYAARREEVLKKESQTRLQQYHLGMRQYQNNTMGGGVDMTPHGGYSSSGGGGPFPSDVQAQHPLAGRGGHFSNQRQRRGPPESYGRGREQGLDLRGPPSAGGGFNNPGPRYY